jgi:Zn-dependent oligopeptidase
VLDGLGLNRQSLSAFFNLCTVLDGFQWLCYRLYGIRFQKSEPEEGECWPGNVLKLNVFRENETADSYQFPIYLGTIFVDFDTRKSKQQGDCHFTVRCSKLVLLFFD